MTDIPTDGSLPNSGGLFDFSLAEEPIRHKSKRMNYFKATVQNIDFDQKLCKCKSECDAHDGKDKYFEVC